MKVDRERCIGCRQCFAQCPVRAISLREGKADIHQDRCVECHICAYSGVCPKNALVIEELSYPRSLRSAFSDVKKPHKDTGVLGRGTEEMKTNDVTARLKLGRLGISVELGRPGVSTSFRDVQTIAMKLAPLSVHFEPENPVTSLMTDIRTGALREEVLEERALSALVEIDIPEDRLMDVIHALQEAEPEVDTVFSLCIASPLDPETGDIPFAETLRKNHIPFRLNGKTNVGLGRPFKEVERA